VVDVSQSLINQGFRDKSRGIYTAFTRPDYSFFEDIERE